MNDRLFLVDGSALAYLLTLVTIGMSVAYMRSLKGGLDVQI